MTFLLFYSISVAVFAILAAIAMRWDVTYYNNEITLVQLIAVVVAGLIPFANTICIVVVVLFWFSEVGSKIVVFGKKK